MVNPHVSKINLIRDDIVILTVEVVDIGAGRWTEISGYIIQQDVIEENMIQERGAFIPFSAIQQVSDPVDGVSTVTVSVAATGLKPGIDVKVITRAAETQIWPTVLRAVEAEHVSGVTATWEARNDAPVSARRSSRYPGQRGSVSTATSSWAGHGGDSGTSNVTVTGPGGAKFAVTIDLVPLGEPGETNA
jgi:hypothetical protein